MKVTKTVLKTENEEVTEEFRVFTPAVYDKIKWFVTIVLPALSALYLTLATQWGLPNPEKVVATVMAITAFLGVCLGISSNRYKESDAGTVGDFVVAEDGGGAASMRLVLNEDPELMKNQERITFKVRKVAA